MVMSLPNELANSFDELLSLLKQSTCYQEYLVLENKLQNHDEILSLIRQIKDVQKQLVRAEHSQQDIEIPQQKYQQLLTTLNEYPLYVAFLEKQKEVNEMFQIVKTRIEETFDEIVLKGQK